MNAARDLANTGTPGPWSYYEDHGRDITDEGWSLVGAAVADRLILLTYPTGSEHEDVEADATKTVRAVNALPAIADLLSVLSGHVACDCCPDDPRCLACGSGEWPCATARARDAVEAALRGES